LMTLEEKLQLLPAAPGVYIHKDVDGKIIYVGKAKVLKNRVASLRSPHGTLQLTIEANIAEVYTETCEALSSSENKTLLLFTLQFDCAVLPRSCAA